MNPSINAIKLNLIVSNVTTKALQFKLEEMIKQRNPSDPNGIKAFLNQKYYEYISTKKFC